MKKYSIKRSGLKKSTTYRLSTLLQLLKNGVLDESREKKLKAF
jgi:hypothetical protein